MIHQLSETMRVIETRIRHYSASHIRRLAFRAIRNADLIEYPGMSRSEIRDWRKVKRLMLAREKISASIALMEAR